jgi:PilZ domain
MSNQTPTELAELTISVLSAFPHELASPLIEDPSRTEQVVLERAEGELFVARWSGEPPDVDAEREFRLAGDDAVYLLTATVAGYGPDEGSRLLRVTGLRRKRQRRTAPRTEVRDLVLISDDVDIDAELVDISAGGVAFLLDRPLAVDRVIRAVLNIDGGVMSTVARVKQVTRLAVGYRIGCVFTEISEPHRAQLGRHAERLPLDRRARFTAGTLRGRLSLPD